MCTCLLLHSGFKEVPWLHLQVLCGLLKWTRISVPLATHVRFVLIIGRPVEAKGDFTQLIPPTRLPLFLAIIDTQSRCL